MLDIIFVVLMVVIIVKADRQGIVNDTLCSVALVIGILAGVLGLVQAFFTKGESVVWGLNIVVTLIAFALKRVAEHFAKLHNDREEERAAQYRAAKKRHTKDFDTNIGDIDDPNVRFGGGDGSNWQAK